MTVGITYDLRSEWLALGYSELETAELDREETVEAVDAALRADGFATERVGSFRSLMAALAAGRTWDLVFNFCEGMHGLGRESLVPALLDAYRIPYTFSDPAVLGVSLHKGLAKRVVRDAGVRTPDFAVIESVSDIEKVTLSYPLFAKPLAEGTGKGVTPRSRISGPDELPGVCQRLLVEHRQPVLVEEYLPGREFTTGILGTGAEAEAVGTMEVVMRETAEPNAYTYINKEDCDERVLYEIVGGKEARSCAEISLRAWRALGCRDSGRVDLRMDSRGRVSFIEVNPLAGLHPKHSDLPIVCSKVGISFPELIHRIMMSARSRCGR
ncbi:MAG TPA: D-alanine--D-alanine ligase [Spirochaetia bacterium]|nr:D-alanine--D-alanine ligase [Spirochaetia bacterium]